jgi:hypothetical protein
VYVADEEERIEAESYGLLVVPVSCNRAAINNNISEMRIIMI